MVRGLKVTLILVIAICCWLSSSTYGAPSANQCKVERKNFINSCADVVYGQPASGDCCAKIRATHFECICPYVTPKIAAYIGVQRAMKIAKGCGRRIPPNFKCGSLRSPPKRL
ncbi:hypothetical protein LIER_39029 [Lithospermum erythrorhizon]|uniref:Bifunctional inhibitor/plant lipid transfer protein/seed storage helical domain-containing protein n=1 Tax=Lithospermum erythrorhizon TaxID=34254 RepID=A0AAV3QAF8_LITER